MKKTEQMRKCYCGYGDVQEKNIKNYLLMFVFINNDVMQQNTPVIAPCTVQVQTFESFSINR